MILYPTESLLVFLSLLLLLLLSNLIISDRRKSIRLYSTALGNIALLEYWTCSVVIIIRIPKRQELMWHAAELLG